jgi:hypothetical protein
MQAVLSPCEIRFISHTELFEFFGRGFFFFFLLIFKKEKFLRKKSKKKKN